MLAENDYLYIFFFPPQTQEDQLDRKKKTNKAGKHPQEEEQLTTMDYILVKKGPV